MEQIDVVKHALTVLERLSLPYIIVGSMASIAYGEPRYTHDIDILVDLNRQQVPAFCQSFPPPDWYVSESAAVAAVEQCHQFNVIHTTSGNKIDVIVPPDTEWRKLQFQRREQIGIVEDVIGFAAHPEDVILGKLLYFQEGGSDKHLRDIMGILDVSGDRIDIQRLSLWADKLNVRESWELILRGREDAQSL